MNIPAALISTIIGAAFFAGGYSYYIQPPSFMTDYALPAMLAPNHAKARAAVTRLLLNPGSAEFDLLKTVDVNAAKYVCGNVNAKDQSGSYAGYHAFVYTVAVDFARIDDNGRISQKHAAFKACPASDDEEPQQKTAISPGALAAAKAVQKAIPASGDQATLSKMASRMPGSDKVSSGGSMQQQLGQLAGDPVSEGDSGTSGQEGGKGGTSETRVADNKIADNENENEREWRSDRPPAAWPEFPPHHPLGKPTAARTPAEAIAFANGIEDRWEESKSGNPRLRPSSDEIKQACRALLTIDPKDDQFPKAWATFVRLRRIDREARRM